MNSIKLKLHDSKSYLKEVKERKREGRKLNQKNFS
jgi:hypothetical protein